MPEQEKNLYNLPADAAPVAEAMDAKKALADKEQAQAEAEKIREKAEEISDGENVKKEDYEDDENKLEKREKIIIDNIKESISNKKLCLHSPSSIFMGIIKEGVDSYNFHKEDLKNIDILKSFFENGIWSEFKIRYNQVLGKKHIKASYGYGPEAQRASRELGINIMNNMLSYMEEKVKMGEKLEDLNYDLMRNDKTFRKNVLSYVKKREEYSAYNGTVPDSPF